MFAQAQRDRAGTRAGDVVERSLTQIIDPCPRFNRDDPLQDALDGHLGGQEHHARRRERHPNGESESERRLSAGRVAAEHDEVTASQSAAEHPVEARKTGRHRGRRRRAIRDGVDAREKD